MKTSKSAAGVYGSLKVKRQKELIISAILLAAVFIIFFSAKMKFGTIQNYFSILAALLCLPAARSLVNFIMLVKARGCSAECYKEVREDVDAIKGAYDLYMTSYSENYAVSCAAAAAGSVLLYSEDKEISVKNAENHVRKMIQSNGIHGWTVKVFTDMNAFLTRLQQVRELETNEKEAAEIMDILKSISL